MAQDVVVKEALSEAMVRDGAALVAQLDDANRRVSSALWFYSPDTNAWQLLIASPEVRVRGPKKVYMAIQSTLRALEPSDRELALEDIAVIPDDYPLILLLRSFINTGPGIGRIRFSKNVINGHFIDDALIYRLT